MQNEETTPPAVPSTSTDYPPTIPSTSTSMDHPPAVPSTSYAVTEGGRVPVDTTHLHPDMTVSSLMLIVYFTVCINMYV